VARLRWLRRPPTVPLPKAGPANPLAVQQLYGERAETTKEGF